MTLFEFRLLSDFEQRDLLYKQGTYIGKRKIYGLTVVAYQLENFYVEVFYTAYRKHINQIRCFLNTNRLEPYLEQMDIEDLIKTELKK
jgi:hypothetical protein